MDPPSYGWHPWIVRIEAISARPMHARVVRISRINQMRSGGPVDKQPKWRDKLAHFDPICSTHPFRLVMSAYFCQDMSILKHRYAATHLDNTRA